MRNMSKNLSDNRPVRRCDKSYVKNFPLDDRYIFPIFDSLVPLLGKYESPDSHCFILHQNNTSAFNSMESEMLLLRFSDTEYENQMLCAHKIYIDIRCFIVAYLWFNKPKGLKVAKNCHAQLLMCMMVDGNDDQWAQWLISMMVDGHNG